jgi:hypothetical protein
MKMEPIEGSETSAFKTQTPGKYPKENIPHKEHGESLKWSLTVEMEGLGVTNIKTSTNKSLSVSGEV